MSYFYKAEEHPNGFYFEVCDTEQGKCKHRNTLASHRTYSWSKSVMTVERCVEEVKLLEAALTAAPILKSIPVFAGKSL